LLGFEIAIEPSKAVKEYKEELIKSQKQNERLTALVGKVTVEKEWLAKKQVHHMQFFITDGLKPKIIFFTTTGPNDLYEILYKDSQKLVDFKVSAHQNHKLPITALLSFKSRKN
jgi:hypothetical protein